MNKNEIIKDLKYIKSNCGDRGAVLKVLDELILKIQKESIFSNKYKTNKKRLMWKSQAGQILKFLKENPNKEFWWSDFMWNSIFKNFRYWTPFIWYSATARLSELKRWGFVEISWKIKWIKKFFYKSKDRNLYKITEKGLKYNLR